MSDNAGYLICDPQRDHDPQVLLYGLSAYFYTLLTPILRFGDLFPTRVAWPSVFCVVTSTNVLGERTRDWEAGWVNCLHIDEGLAGL